MKTFLVEILSLGLCATVPVIYIAFYLSLKDENLLVKLVGFLTGISAEALFLVMAGKLWELGEIDKLLLFFLAAGNLYLVYQPGNFFKSTSFHFASGITALALLFLSA